MKKNNNKGFTFIELILYMAILGIFMVAVVSLVSTTVYTNKSRKSREKLETQATETYDSIADIIMGAMEVKIDGKGSVGDGTTYNTVQGSFIVPEESYLKSSAGARLLTSGGTADVIQTAVKGGTTVKSSKCYDIADVKPESYIDVDYLLVEYCSTLDNLTFCTIKYDETDKKLYIAKQDVNQSVYENAKKKAATGDSSAQSTLNSYRSYVDESNEKGTVLAKNVTGFQMQVDAENNSVAVKITFLDEQTNKDYEITGVVGIRNSFVLKKHEWN